MLGPCHLAYLGLSGAHFPGTDLLSLQPNCVEFGRDLNFPHPHNELPMVYVVFITPFLHDRVWPVTASQIPRVTQLVHTA